MVWNNRRDLQLADEEGVDCLPNSTIFEQLALMGWWSQVPRNHGDTIAQTRFENVSKHFNDSLLARESSDNEENLDEDASKQGRIDAIDADEEIILEMFVAEHEVATNKENDEVNIVEEVVEVINTTNLITDAAQVSADGNVVSIAVMQQLNKKYKTQGERGCIQELGESTTTISSQLYSQQLQDKGKGILIEPIKPIKKKDLIRLGEEIALKLQAEFNEEERLAREKAEKEKEANIALIETWDEIQAKIDVDYQLAERM
ncbi:hypothetical protein Tco_0411508 [Tanacetum coccineum]